MRDDSALLLRDMDPAVLGDRIRRLRVERRLTQADLAKGSVSVAYISRIESGNRKPEISSLEAIAGNLGVTARFLLVGDETATRTLVELELDYAAIELAAGDVGAARQRVSKVFRMADPDLAEVATYLDCWAMHIEGEDPVERLRALLDSGVTNNLLWLRTKTLLTRVLRDHGDYDNALVTGYRALEHLDQFGLRATREGVDLALVVASVHTIRGDRDKALEVANEALRFDEYTGDRETVARAFLNASLVEQQADNISSALDLAKRSLELIIADQDIRNRVRLLNRVGSHLLRDQPPVINTALERLAEAELLAGTSNISDDDKCRTQLATAQAKFLAGDTTGALGALKLIRKYRDTINRSIAAESMLVYSRVLRSTNSPGAKDALAEAIELAATATSGRALRHFWYEVAGDLETDGDIAGSADAYRRAAIAGGATAFSAGRSELVAR